MHLSHFVFGLSMSVKLGNVLDTAFGEIAESYNFQLDSEEATAAMWAKMKSMVKNQVAPLITNLESTIKRASVNKSETTTKADGKPKKSHSPNYYAHFHGCCSTKKPRDAGPLATEHVFKFRPELIDLVPDDDKHKRRQAQQAVIDLVNAKDETCASFTEFETNTISSISDFIETHEDKDVRNIDQMKRTSMIWWLFLTEDERKEFHTWYEVSKTSSAVSKPVKKVSIKPVKSKTTKVQTVVKPKPPKVSKPPKVEEEETVEVEEEPVEEEPVEEEPEVEEEPVEEEVKPKKVTKVTPHKKTTVKRTVVKK